MALGPRGLFVRRAARFDVNAFYMSWSKDSRGGGPRGYHHGDLRETLIRAALELIAQKGSAGFTFADAARWAGVSPAAPYRHFRDRDDLLANVALRGFEQFEIALVGAWDDGRPDALTALDRMGKAYLGFARAEPAYYSAMFESGIAPDTSSRIARGRRSRLRCLASGCGKGLRPGAAARSSAAADAGASYLGDVAWHRFVVRAWRFGAPHRAHGTGRPVRGGGSYLSQGSWRWSGCWRCRRRSETAARLSFYREARRCRHTY